MDSVATVRPPAPPSASAPGREGRAAVRLLAVLVGFGGVAVLYVAADIMIPLVAALLLAAAFAPVQRAICRHAPRALGASLIAIVLAGLLALSVVGLSKPAARWIEKAPEIAAEMKFKLREIAVPVADVKRASRKVEEIANVGDEKNDEQVVVREGSMLARVAESMRLTGVQLLVMIVVLWFLLAAGPALADSVTRGLADRRARRRFDVAGRRVTRDISSYMLTVFAINIGLGIAVALALWAAGMPNPMLWGAMAAVLNFVPYAGAAIGVAIVFVVGLMSFETVLQAVVPAAFYAVLSAIEGQWLTPLILGRRLALNPLVLFLFVLFWGWLWGVPGALMAVPILVSVRTVCVYTMPNAALTRMILGHEP